MKLQAAIKTKISSFIFFFLEGGAEYPGPGGKEHMRLLCISGLVSHKALYFSVCAALTQGLTEVLCTSGLVSP